MLGHGRVEYICNKLWLNKFHLKQETVKSIILLLAITFLVSCQEERHGGWVYVSEGAEWSHHKNSDDSVYFRPGDVYYDNFSSDNPFIELGVRYKIIDVRDGYVQFKSRNVGGVDTHIGWRESSMYASDLARILWDFENGGFGKE